MIATSLQRALSVGLLASLLPLSAGSATQPAQPWSGNITRDTAADDASSALPTPVATTDGITLDIPRFEAIASALTTNPDVPGLAMAIVKDGEILSARGYGITDVRSPETVDAHTVFRLASLSKSFAGTMTGILVNDGVLRWDSRLTDYVPSFQMSVPDAAEKITVADILSHRVGLPHNTYDRDIEANAAYRDLVAKLANTPMTCAPGDCYAYQNVAFSLIGDVVFSATGQFFSESVASRIFKPLGMHDASYGLEGIQASARWAKPHIRARNGATSLTPKPTYYRVAPAAGVNASISDMAQWLLAHTGYQPEVLPAPLLATLHASRVDTPSEMRGPAWRRDRLTTASYALGWRAYTYAGHDLVFHGGAVQGYRGMMALLPEQNLGVVVLWNSESALPSGLLPTILDNALALDNATWVDKKVLAVADTLLDGEHHARSPAGSSSAASKASPP